ncbi:MAG: PEGA domain-containing protein, partial [Candidatus Marinimicrobia bacterium]|nr:PEGA domain-containing protein [Candidatus Neomarinimicrobiota bacterium]
MKNQSLLFFILLILIHPIFSQELKEMEIETVSESESIPTVVLNSNEAILVVHSTITKLNFESNRGIISVDKPDLGEYRVHLHPGTNIITFKADGYSPIKKRYHIPKKEYKELRVKPKSLMILEKEKAYEITFKLNVDNVYCSYEQFAPIMKKNRLAKYKLPKGEYTFRFEKDQYKIYTKKIKVEKDETFEINLIKDKSQRIPYRPPGMVTIESNPPGAEVLINGQKMGSTPFSGELTSGKHRLEIRKKLYYQHISDFILEAGETKNISHALKPKYGYLSITSQLEDVEISLDGKPIGATPIDKEHVMSGKHKIIAKKDSYHNYETIFEIQDNQKKTVKIVLDPAIVSLAINSSPEDGVEVWVDGKLKGVTPFLDNS